jgi:hypothetical protein
MSKKQCTTTLNDFFVTVNDESNHRFLDDDHDQDKNAHNEYCKDRMSSASVTRNIPVSSSGRVVDKEEQYETDDRIRLVQQIGRPPPYPPITTILFVLLSTRFFMWTTSSFSFAVAEHSSSSNSNSKGGGSNGVDLDGKVDGGASQSTSPLQCDLYIASSTIPHAGLGIFSGISNPIGATIGNVDKAIPLIDLDWHNGAPYQEGTVQNGEYSAFFNPLLDFVWEGEILGMGLESADQSAVSTFWPGVDAMVNCQIGLINTLRAHPTYDEGGLQRDVHPGAGAITPYGPGSTRVVRHIPEGGEIFKSYGDGYFETRPAKFGQIPLSTDYDDILELMTELKSIFDLRSRGNVASALYDDVIVPIKEIWNNTSRTLNALHDFSWDDIQRAINEDDMGILIQPMSVRSIDWLNNHGWCIDHIVHGLSTIEGAGYVLNKFLMWYSFASSTSYLLLACIVLFPPFHAPH